MRDIITIDWLHQQRILVLGLAREGLSSYRFLRQQFPTLELWLTDDRKLDQLSSEWTGIVAADPLAHYIHSAKALTAAQPTLIFKTPGLPPRHPLVQTAESQAIPITSNTQLFFDLLAQSPQRSQFQVIGITGTKGKSTTSALIYHLCQTAQLPSVLGGNIGVPPLDLWPQLANFSVSEPPSVKIVLELSCHQLADLQSSPDIAVIQNIVPEHLDYYATFEEYVAAKSQITRFQTPENYVIFNPTFEQPKKLAALSPAHQLWFSEVWQPELTAFIKENQIWSQNPVTGVQNPLLPTSELPLKGQHNLQNVMPSVVLAQLWNVDAETLRTALKTFKALEHRLEFVADIQGVQFYNDSMSTMPAATIGAIKAFPHQPLILIAGGHERHLDFNELGAVLAQTPSLKKLILFKPTGEHIWDAMIQATSTPEKLPPHVFVESMPEAIAQATEVAQPGNIVLLSPASASFGTFVDYRDRGNQFKANVKKLSL